MSDTYVRLPADTTLAIADQMRVLGWDPEYVTDSEIKMTFPDPDTERAMRFSEFWLSWRLIDGRLTYGVGDDIGDPWRKQLDVDADASPEAVAVAADRVMHLLWHFDERDALSELHQKYMLLSAMQIRMQELGRRMLVTPGMIRDALKPSGR
ncbi:hypothetical protein [Streptomyces asiaticus]|uniref:hypothetical protein n=1 Tax=Streptomyces asiaticus TaxID=114695 RepID=UPI001BA956EC|nr:hypothetical protein [Streptomyces asiaticus]